MRVAAALVLALAAAGPNAAVHAQDTVQRVLDRLQAVHGFPGATVAWVDRAGRVEARATGFADPAAGDPMRPESRMLAASIGKSFVAAAVLALREEGRVGLDDRLVDWLGGRPWFHRLPNHRDLTLRHVLTHSGGLPDHVYHRAFPELFHRGGGDDAPPGPEELIALVLDADPLFPAGRGWSYSDTGYLLAGLVIEEAWGGPWTELVEQRFLRPLELSRTEPSDRPLLSGLAVGTTGVENPFGLPARTLDGEGRLAWHPGIEGAGGGFVTTAADLARWGRLVWSGRAMDAPYLEVMLRGVPMGPDAPGATYGLAVRIDAQGDFGEVRGHAGWIPGYVSSLRYYPAHDVAIAIQVNTDVGMLGEQGSFMELEAAVTRAVLGADGTEGAQADGARTGQVPREPPFTR